MDTFKNTSNEAHSDKEKPLIYSCSGASKVAQLANDMTLSIHSSGAAEMSCIAGVGGKLPTMVAVAKSGRTIIAVDGCRHHCARHCLLQNNINPDFHFELTAMGVRHNAEFPVNFCQSAQILKIIHDTCNLQS